MLSREQRGAQRKADKDRQTDREDWCIVIKTYCSDTTHTLLDVHKRPRSSAYAMLARVRSGAAVAAVRSSAAAAASSSSAIPLSNTIAAPAHSSAFPCIHSSASRLSVLPSRSFATVAGTKGKKGGKASAASSSSSGASAQSDRAATEALSSLHIASPFVDLEPSDIDFYRIPPIPKPSQAELDAAQLNEKQLRFAKRPMVPPEERAELLRKIYAQPDHGIEQHTKVDLGKYYPLDQSMIDLIPRQIHKPMAQEMMGGGKYMMIRPAGLEVVQSLKSIYQHSADPSAFAAAQASDRKLAKRVLGIRGNSGCGKSATLHQAVQLARAQSLSNPSRPWLILATRGEEFTQEKRGFIKASAVKAGVYDQALYTMDYFSKIVVSEESALKLMPLQTGPSVDEEYLPFLTWKNGSDNAEGRTMYDLAQLAATDREQAPRALYAFMQQLKVPTACPVLIAIDNLNVWDQVCEFIEPYTYEQMQPRKLALVDAFDYFTKRAPATGATVWALTTRYATLDHAFRHFDRPQVRGIDTFWYSAREYRHCMIHYSVSEFILGVVNTDLLERVAGLTGRVPRDVFEQAFFR